MFACLLALGLAPGLRDGASAALACDDGRPGGCSAPGQALAHGYRADPDRQAAPRWPACCLRPPKGRLRSAPWQAKGSPASPAPKPPQGGNRGSHQVRAEPRRRLYRSVLLWAVVALGSCAPFLLLQAGGQQPCTRRRTRRELRPKPAQWLWGPVRHQLRLAGAGSLFSYLPHGYHHIRHPLSSSIFTVRYGGVPPMHEGSSSRRGGCAERGPRAHESEGAGAQLLPRTMRLNPL